MELTEEGQAFLARTRAILDAMDAAEEEMATRREAPTGLLRVNAASPFMLHAIVPLVPEFHRLFPGIHLELNTDDLNVDLLAQRTDIAIRIGALSTRCARTTARCFFVDAAQLHQSRRTRSLVRVASAAADFGPRYST